jgi:hypothetical protein
MSKQKSEAVISRDILKLESIGKSGKVNKPIDITVTHLDSVK